MPVPVSVPESSPLRGTRAAGQHGRAAAAPIPPGHADCGRLPRGVVPAPSRVRRNRLEGCPIASPGVAEEAPRRARRDGARGAAGSRTAFNRNSCARAAVRVAVAVAIALGGVATALPAPSAGPTVALAQQGGAFAIGQAVVVGGTNGDGLLLREGPGFDAATLGAFPDGTVAVITDGPIGAEDGTVWYGVEVEGQTGYMLADYLVAAPGGAPGAATGPSGLPPGVPSGTAPGTTSVDDGDGSTNAGRTGNATTSASPGTLNPGGLDAAGNGPSNVSVDADGPLTTVNADGQPQPQPQAPAPAPAEDASGVDPAAEDQASQDAAAAQTAGAFQAPLAAGGEAATTDVVNLRAAASWEAEVLRVLPPGAPVTITGEAQGEWTPVFYNGTDGWMVSQYLQPGGAAGPETAAAQPAEAPAAPLVDQPAADAPAAAEGPRSGAATVVEAAELKAEPSAAAATVGALAVGTSFAPEAGPEQGFYRTTVDGVTGWVSGAYLTFDGSNAGNPGATADAAPAATDPAATGATEAEAAATPDDEPAGDGEAAAFSGIVWPVNGGAWSVMQGYNGSSHVNRDAQWQYAYALDIVREDGETAGVPVTSPVNGVVRWTDPGSGGLSIDLGNGHAVAMFHVTLDGALAAGKTLRQGDPVGSISGPGGMGFSGMPHLHLALWQTDDGGNWDRAAVPFTGQFSIEGSDFPDVGGGQPPRGCASPPSRGGGAPPPLQPDATYPSPKNASSRATNSSGRSSAIQWPQWSITPPLTSVATARALCRETSPVPAAPPSASTGIGSGVRADSRLSAASCGKARNQSKPARMPPGAA
jgi:uncharacterized protein YgiM (DUF1202 family)